MGKFQAFAECTTNKEVIVDHLANKLKNEETTPESIKSYWSRVFQHVKKQYDIKEKMVCHTFIKLTRFH